MNTRHPYPVCLLLLVILAAFPVQVVSGEPQGEAQVRRVWNARQRQFQAALYHATWVDTCAGKQGQERKTGSMDATMAFDKWTYRFDINEGRQPSEVEVLVLDKTGFHVRATADSLSNAKDMDSRLVSPGSRWILAYPLLLSHGIVPMPPFSLEGMMRTEAKTNSASVHTAQRNSTTLKDFRWFAPRGDLEVRVQSPRGVVSGFQVYQDGEELLNITVSYENRSNLPVVRRFSIEWFDPDGTVTHRVDAEVKTVSINEPFPAVLFGPPRTQAELLTELGKHWDKKLNVAEEMSLTEITQALQHALGDSVCVQVDVAAFHKPIEFEAPTLTFEDRTITVAELMLGKLQANALDFLFGPFGVRIVPRHVAWQSPQARDYSAKDYGVTVEQLQGILREIGTPDEWEDVGGPATISVDHENGSITIFHTPSEQIRFSLALQIITKSQEHRE